jgi:hypothetical protein
MPVVIRLGMVAAVVALGVAVLSVAAGGLGVAVGGVGSTLGGFIQGVTATPTPAPSIAALSDAPLIEQPSEPYNSAGTADLIVTVPAALAGDPDHRVRVYLALDGQDPAAIQETPLGETARTIIPIQLSEGINDFTVTIVGPGGESDPSLVARYVFDDTPPKITITSPKNNGTVNRQAVEIKGKTQARTTLSARNEANGSSITTTAAADGTFTLSLALSGGSNPITISGKDPAGNTSEAKLTVKRGDGKLVAKLSASDYRIRRGRLPEPVTLIAKVTDPDGKPLAGAPVTFTLSIPGIPTVTSDTTTDERGRASFRTTVPTGADLGDGSATVLVSTDEFGATEDFTVISIVR